MPIAIKSTIRLLMVTNCQLNLGLKSKMSRVNMPKILTDAYACIDQMAVALQGVSRKPRSKPLRPYRNDHIHKRRVKTFEANMQELKGQWSKTIKEVVRNSNDTTMMDELADYIVNLLYRLSQKFDIDEPDGILIVKTVVRPIIGGIMDEKEFDSISKQKQEMRKQFLFRLISNLPPIEPLERVETEESQATSSTGHTQNTNFLDEVIIIENTEQNIVEQQYYTSHPVWISEHVLNFVIDALTLHSKKVGGRDVDIVGQIYHIINITHIVDIVNKYLEMMNQHKQLSQNVGVELRPEAIERYRRSISENLKLFNIDHPLTIFRNDLRSILNQIRILKPPNFMIDES